MFSFPGGCVVQVVGGHPSDGDADVTGLAPATIVLSSDRLVAQVGEDEWSWLFREVEDVFHGGEEPWTIVAVPGVPDHGVAVSPTDVDEFRNRLEVLLATATRALNGRVHPPPAQPLPAESRMSPPDIDDTAQRVALHIPQHVPAPVPPPIVPPPTVPAPAAPLPLATGRRGRLSRPRDRTRPAPPSVPAGLAGLDARRITAWFGTHQVLENVSLEMAPGEVTALIGPSGCGKSTFLRILNRMHELIPSAALAGEVLLDGQDIYDIGRKVTDARRQIGMVFQKPNPFPAMSIYDNVLASFQLTGLKVGTDAKDEVVESCLRKAGLWTEVRDRLRQRGGGLSGGQQQRLCIARALAIKPRVLLMDEPCSALDPTSTRRIEQTIAELASEVTIVIVTHNMQQAARVSDQCAFFLAEQGKPGFIVEHGPTEAMFHSPQDERTNDYVNGRFG